MPINTLTFPLPNWAIVYNGMTKVCSDWGVEDLALEFLSQGKDVLSFRIPKAGFDEDRVFAYGETILLKKYVRDTEGQFVAGFSQTIWFQGTVIKPRGMAQPSGEGQHYVVVGPWYWLEECVFQQIWYYYTAPGGVQTPEYTSHLMLNGTADGISFVSTAETITAALNYCLDQFPVGAKPFQIGTIDIGTIYPPVHEARDASVHDVIGLQLRWHLDAVSWFDYTVNPPRLNIKKYSALTPVELKTIAALDDDESAYVDGVELETREDLQRPAVVIKWEIKGETDGRAVLNLVQDKYPPSATGREIGALMYTVDAMGPTLQTLAASVVVDDLPDTATVDWAAQAQLAFWQREFVELTNDRIAQITIVSAGRVLLNDDGTETVLATNPTNPAGAPVGLPYKLLAGGVAPWMTGGLIQRERISVKVTFKVYRETYNASANPPQEPVKGLEEAQIFTKEITTTNVPTGDYTGGSQVIEEGELIWLGLAQAVYEPLQILHYSGTFVLHEEEVTARVRPGMVINILGSAAEYGSMLAMVQSVREEIGTGRSIVTVGPPGLRGVEDLVELFRVNRVRRRQTPLGAQADGSLASGTTTEIPKGPNTDRGVGSDDFYNLFVVRERTAPTVLKLDAVNSLVTFGRGAANARKLKTIDLSAGTIVFEDEATSPRRSVTIALGACVGGGVNRQLAIREVEVCVNNVTRHMLVLCSEAY